MPKAVLIINNHKPCGKCKQNKPIEEFAKSSKTPSGLRSYCVKCDRSYYQDSEEVKRRVKENREKRFREDPEYKKLVRERNRIRQQTTESRKITNANNKKRREEDVQFKLRGNITRNTTAAIKNHFKSGKTIELLGCSIEHLKIYIESLWQPGMTWNNWGRMNGDGRSMWQIDHIIPCSAFDLSKPEEQRKCFHWSNLQPLWAIDNIKKSNWVIDYQI